MSAAALAERPAHVPADLVVDFDIYAPPGVERDYHAAWLALQKPELPPIVWTPRNGGHWIAARGAVIGAVDLAPSMGRCRVIHAIGCGPLIEWRHLDAKTRTILVENRKDPRNKDGNDQRVPLLAATGYDAYQILEEQRQRIGGNGGRCFPYNGRSVGTNFRRTCQELKIENLHFHDLRHEGTSRLFEAGLTIEQVPLVTGHKDWKMLRRYTHLRPEALHEIAARRSA